MYKDTPLKLSKALTFDQLVTEVNKSGIGYISIINEVGALYGIVTDADIRKALLKKDYSLETIINRKPNVGSVLDSFDKSISFLKKSKRRHLPIVGNLGKYQGVVCLDLVDFDIKMNAVVIMAGGLGTRLGELTKNIPKPMLHVAGKPILERIIHDFKDQGFINFYISVNYKKEVIMDYFGDGSNIGVSIKYLIEKSKLGTAGALSLLPEGIKFPIIVSNGDVLAKINYHELLSFHLTSNSASTMCLREHKTKVQYGVVDIDSDSNIVTFKEKPEFISYVNAGVYALNKNIVINIEQDEYLDMPSLFERACDLNLITKGFNINDYWIDIGLKDHFEKANQDFKEI